MKNFKKISALLLAFALILTSFGAISVFAYNDVKIPVEISVKTSKQEITAGKTFKVNVNLDFSEGDMALANGIQVFKSTLKYDPMYLQPLNPETGNAVNFDDQGNASDNFYTFGNIGLESSLTVNINETRDGFIILYGGTGEGNNLTEPGYVVQFTFMAKDDVELNGKTLTSLKMANPDFALKESGYSAEVTTGAAGISILPQFEIPSFGSKRQNDELLVVGKVYFSDKNQPLMASIRQDDAVIEEKEAKVANNRYTVKFDLSETTYAPGDYYFVLTYGAQTLSQSFGIDEKQVSTVPEAPVEPDDKDEDKQDDKKDDTNNSTTKPDTNPGTNPGINPDEDDKIPGTNVTPGTTTGISPKPTVKYPSDIVSHWAVDNIKYVYDNKLMNGYDDGTFLPEGNITRGEYAAVMSRLLNLAQDEGVANGFDDCNGHWAKGYIGALVNAGIVNGVSETSFMPDAFITRQEIAAILARAYKLECEDQNGFADHDSIASWAIQSVYSVKEAGLMQGDTNNCFLPNNFATRAEVATVITRLHKNNK